MGRRVLVAVALLALVVVFPIPVQQASAAPCDPPIVNPVACENTKPGNPSSEWDVDGAGATSIQGFATDISVNKGETVHFKISSTTTAYRLDIYRMGYYGGMGARKVATVNPTSPASQPACLQQSTTGLMDCGNWSESASWAVPSDAVSGIYFARLVRTADGGASHVVFIVRDDASTSKLFFQTSDSTWQAYNDYGGNNFYKGNPAGRAYKLSYNRPFNTRVNYPEDWVFNSEYPMVRFLESNGYDISYTTNVDSDRRGNLIKNHATFLSVGHDEYWSGAQRTNVEAARDAGVNLAFFSGNEVFWKTRFENSVSSPATAYRTLVTYKETHAGAKIDPLPDVWTGTWRDPRFSPPADGGRPENRLTGTLFTVNGPQDLSIKVPAADGKMRLWRNTTIATQTAGQTAVLPQGTLGYEWDEDIDNGFRPPGTIQLSNATYSVSVRIQDWGTDYGPGNATHAMTLHREPSGALVFGAGTIQWPWGLDSNHDRGSAAADVRMQQATVNLLADMGAQPTTLRPGLVPATASTDTTPPTSTITNPPAGAALTLGTPVTISGTATDTGGGVVGGVEVSLDGGKSWRRANGRASWSYTWTPTTNASYNLRSRATDDSANMETPGAGIVITGGTGGPLSVPGVCPCTIWSPADTPVLPSQNDSSSVVLGNKFRTSAAGFITGVRFYKGTGNTGTHVGSLWTSSGTLLASATFTGESSTGWQQVSFATPVAVSANTTYVASFLAPNGHYAGDEYGTPSAGVTNGPLKSLANNEDGPNGVYKYSSSNAFPTDTWMGEAYWVDVTYMPTNAPDTTPPTVTSKSPAAGATGVAASANVTATFSEAVQPASVAFTVTDPGGASVPAAVTYDSASRTSTLNPTADLALGATYTARVNAALDTAGNALAAPVVWTFTTVPPDTTPPTVTSKSPAAGATGVAASANVTATFSEAVQPASVAFTLTDPGGTSVPAAVTYDSASSTSTLNPTADLALGTTYTARVNAALDTAGNALAAPVVWTFTTVPPDTTPPTVTNVTATPSQSSALVSWTTNEPATTVVNYGTDPANLTSSVSNLSLTTSHAITIPSLASGTQYSYRVTSADAAGNAATSPTPPASPLTFTTTLQDVTPPVISNVAAAPATTSATVTWTTDESSDSRVDYGTDPAALTSTATSAGSGTTHSVALTGLTAGTVYYYRVTSRDAFLNSATSPPTASAPLSFTTQSGGGGANCPCSIWPSSAVPLNPSEPDSAAVVLGTKFQSTSAGYITGVRFYKGTGNTGTHVGSLWTSTGTLLATATFSGESTTGWQSVSFSTPVAISANTTYVASYLAPVGRYSQDEGAFTAGGVTNGPLRALGDGEDGPNGLYRYSSTNAFPTSDWFGSNYWVDVTYVSSLAPDTTPPVISGLAATPGSGGAVVSWTTDEAADTRVDYGTSPSSLTSNVSSAALSTAHSATLPSLAPRTTYYYRVTSRDAAGNTTTAPPTSGAPAQFTTPAASFVDTTTADFALGSLGAGLSITQTADGEVGLTPTLGVEFDGSALPAGWTTTAIQTGGSGVLSGGHLIVDGARTQTTATYSAGRSLEFVATFTGQANQHVGFGNTLNESPWAMFGTRNGGSVWARSRLSNSQTNVDLGAALLGAPHRYRIDWNATNIVFSVDGVVRSTQTRTLSAAMRPVVRDNTLGGGAVDVDWLRITPYAGTGTFTSRVYDAGSAVTWTSVEWAADLPASTTVAISVRTGDVPVPDGSWTAFVPIASSGANPGVTSRYIQYQVVLSSSAAGQSPALRDVTIRAA